MPTISGVFEDRVLGTFRVIRGFADLRTLAAISVPFQLTEGGEGGIVGHQRPLNEAHALEIKTYLEQSDNRFLPEVILSVRTKLEEVLVKPGVRGIRSLGEDGVHISRRYKNPHVHLHDVWVDPRMMKSLLDDRRIRRLDGNHRLAMAEKLSPPGTVPSKYITGFCAILLDEPANSADDYAESLIFYTLNSTALPVDSEHGLKILLGQPPEHTAQAEVEFQRSPILHLTRLLKSRLEGLTPEARARLGDTPLTSLEETARGIVNLQPDATADLGSLKKFADALFGGLHDILTEQGIHQPELFQQDYFLDLASRTWHSAPGKTHTEKVQNAVSLLAGCGEWLRNHDLMGLRSGITLGGQILDIYRKVRLGIPRKVFLARWYPKPDDGDQLRLAGLRLEQVEQTVANVRDEHEVPLELIDLATRPGGTFPIHQELYEALETAQIVLIDLTGVRPNVCIEAGFALKYRESGRLLFMFQPSEEHPRPPFDVDTFRIELIRDTGEVRGKLKPRIEEILRIAGAET